MMFLNSDNKKIISYFKSKSLYDFEKSYLAFLDAGLKIDRDKMKKILKFIRYDDLSQIQYIFTDLFKSSDFLFFNSASSSFRVSKFRKKLKDMGYKNISLQLPAAQFKILKDLKIKKNMTYSELIIFLLNK